MGMMGIFDRFQPPQSEPAELEVLVYWDEDAVPRHFAKEANVPRAQWVVRVNREMRSINETKSKAVDMAREIAKGSRLPATLRILNKDGSLSREHEYGGEEI